MQSFLPSPLSFEVAVWTIVRLRKDGSCHVVGYRLPSGRGRTSSPIRAFDPATDTVTTASGNRYTLVGDPSQAGLDDPLVLAWLAEHDLTRRDVGSVAPVAAVWPAQPQHLSDTRGDA